MKIRNPLTKQTIEQRNKQYIIDSSNGAVAYKSDNSTVPLSQLKPDDVEFIAGMWRVQDKNQYNIIHIRDKEMILGPRIQHTESTHFEYYKVSVLAYNCYGPLKPAFIYVAAKYDTDKGTYLSYGKTIAEARAFLGIALFDEYKELIHNEACKNSLQKTRK